MATFTNQATLSYNNTVSRSNIVTGELVDILAVAKTAVTDTYGCDTCVTYTVSIVKSRRGGVRRAEGYGRSGRVCVRRGHGHTAGIPGRQPEILCERSASRRPPPTRRAAHDGHGDQRARRRQRAVGLSGSYQ